MLFCPSGHPLNFTSRLRGVFYILPLAWICLFVPHGSPIHIVEGGAICIISVAVGRATTRACAFWHTYACLFVLSPECSIPLVWMGSGGGEGGCVGGGDYVRHALSILMSMVMVMVFACDVGTVGGHIITAAVHSWLRIIRYHY